MSDQQVLPVADEDVVTVDKGTSRVSCNGGGVLGHPQIWLTLEFEEHTASHAVTCPYCSKRFVDASS